MNTWLVIYTDRYTSPGSWAGHVEALDEEHARVAGFHQAQKRLEYPVLRELELVL